MTTPVYQTLFKKSTTGTEKIQTWQISVIEFPDKTAEVRIIYGQQDGKKITKADIIREGKCKRTALQQAIQEANSKYKNKIEKELYYTEENFNTSSSPEEKQDSESTNNEFVMRPMLAQTFSIEDYNKLGSRAYKMQFPCYIQPKLDGVRCISFLGEDGHVTMISRKGTSIVGFTNIEESLLPLFSAGIYFDGELYSDTLTFEEITSSVRTSKKVSAKTNAKIKYHIYDVYFKEYPQLSFKERHTQLSEILNVCGSHIVPVETTVIRSAEEIGQFHQNYIELGYEGIMLRDFDGPYEVNKRSKYLQKYKEFLEEEFRIVGFDEENGMVIWKCVTANGGEFNARPRGTFEERRELFQNAENYIGSALTVIFQEYSDGGIPRFPVGKSIRNYE